MLLIAGCANGAGGASGGSDRGAEGPTRSSPSPAATLDPGTASACQAFWGDPDYTDPLSRELLDRAATAADAGPDDPGFYAMTADDLEAAFESAPSDAQQAVAPLADWFRTQPERGTDADMDAFRTAWTATAKLCAPGSAAAAWAVAPGKDGTKPAALVCADITDTPGTLTSYRNANVLTSNMFKVVGLYPKSVPAKRMDDVRATDELLAKEIAAVDDDGVREALTKIRAPFRAAIDGNMWSEGLREPLKEFGGACSHVGYEIPPMDDGSGQGDEGDGGLV